MYFTSGRRNATVAAITCFVLALIAHLLFGPIVRGMGMDEKPWHEVYEAIIIFDSIKYLMISFGVLSSLWTIASFIQKGIPRNKLVADLLCLAATGATGLILHLIGFFANVKPLTDYWVRDVTTGFVAFFIVIIAALFMVILVTIIFVTFDFLANRYSYLRKPRKHN